MITLNFSLILLVLLLFVGFAIDTSNLQWHRRSAPGVAGAAALGALYEKARGNSGWVAAGQTDAATNGLALIGLGCGIMLALLATRFLEKPLFVVKPNDPASFIAVAVTLTAVAFASVYIPAWRAMSLDPLTALRQE